MKTIYIALNTFKENIRDRVLYNLFFFTLLIIGGSVVLGEVSIGQEAKMIVDMSLSAISIFGTLIAIFIGTGLVYKELDKRTIYNLVSKPVHRYEFVLGKYLGLMTTLMVNVVFMFVGVCLALTYLERGFKWEHVNLVPAMYLIYLQLMLVTAIALLFSSFSTPVLSAVFTFLLWLIGHFNAEIKHLATILKSDVISKGCTALYYLLPNFNNFSLVKTENVIQSAAHLHTMDPTVVVFSTLYGFTYTAIILVSAALIFQQRDFK
jgi:ABC-type transport system involved in multi-copper enzyme maturation permease subunit